MAKHVMKMDNKNEQIERIKKELALYLKIAERLDFPKEEIERQVNLYLDNLNKLKSDNNKKHE